MLGRIVRNPFSFLAVRSKQAQYLEQYVLREYGKGRALDEILDDRYLRNRTTAGERARLLDRPEIVAAIGRQAVDDLKLSAAALD